MMKAFPSEPFDETRTKIHFPAVIVTVQNSRVTDICQAYHALSRAFTTHKLAQTMTVLADAWFDPFSASHMDV